MQPSTYRFGEFELDAASRELRRGQARVALPPKSFECLAYLLAHRERAVGRDELISAVWGRVDISDTVVAQTLLRARKALGDTGNQQRLVRTVPRFGYQWIAPLDAMTRAEAMPGAFASATYATGTQTVLERSPAPRRRPWSLTLAIVFLAIAVAAFATWLRMPSPASRAPVAGSSILVLPVSLASGDGDDAWVRLGAMDYMASRLRHSGCTVLPSEQAMHLDAQIGDRARMSATQAQRLAQLSGARWIVAPQAQREGRGWRVRLEIHDDDGQHLVEARGDTPLTAAAIATDSWLHRIDPDRARNYVGPSALDQRVQQIDAELLAGQLVAARRLVESASPQERADPGLRVREGQLEFRGGRVDQAAAIFRSLLSPNARHDAEVRAKALMGLGAVDIRRDDFALAEHNYLSALAVLRDAGSAGDPSLAGNAYNGLGVAQVQQGKMADAVRNMARARIAMQRSGNLIEAASVGTNLGMIERQRGHHAQAMQEFDRAAEVFERFQVHDYMAAALMAKADTQLEMGQAMAAAGSIDRAGALMGSVEDRLLTARIALVRAMIMLALGRLDDAGKALAALHALNQSGSQALQQDLQLRLQLARGAQVDALAIARRMPPPEVAVSGSLALAAVQALLVANETEAALRWIARADGTADADPSLDIARSLLAQAQGHSGEALDTARRISARVEDSGSPEERMRAGLLNVRLLLAQGRADAAAPVLGDLDAFSSTDYRVAWEAWALYRALGDPAMAAQAMQRVQALRGERDVQVPPAL